MRPFTPTEVTKYLLWVVLALALTALLVWRLFLAAPHEQIHPQPAGANVHLSLPALPHLFAPHPVLTTSIGS
jgi:hypothetical protein